MPFTVIHSNRAWKRLAPKATLLGFSLLLSLLLGELLVRIVAPQTLVRSYYTSDPELGIVIRPNHHYVEQGKFYTYTVRTNEFGFRMDESVNRSPDAARVMVLGDSFTFGWGVESEASFLARLGRNIKRRIPYAQLLNGGVGSYSSGHVYKSLKRWAEPLQPCGAIYFMNANDLADNLVARTDYRVTSYRPLPDGSIELTDERAYSPLKRFLFSYTPYEWLNQNSHLFLFVKGLMVASASSRSEDSGDDPGFGVRKISDERSELAINVALAHVDRFEAFSRKTNLPLLIIWIPAWTELFQPKDPENETFRRLKSSVAASFFHDPLPQLQEIVATEGVGVLDFYYRDGDPVGHFTPKGNELYARAVQERVVHFLEESCRRPVRTTSHPLEDRSASLPEGARRSAQTSYLRPSPSSSTTRTSRSRSVPLPAPGAG